MKSSTEIVISDKIRMPIDVVTQTLACRTVTMRKIDSCDFATTAAAILSRMTGETCVAQPHEAGGYKLVRLTGSKMVRG